MSYCNQCKSTTAYRFQISIDDKGKRSEFCNDCAILGPINNPDLFLGGSGGLQTDPNLCDEKGNEIPFSTKGEKKAIMKKLGLRQADSAERQHGSRNESHLTRKTYFM